MPSNRHTWSEFDIPDEGELPDPNWELWMQSPLLHDMPRSAILGVMRVDHCLAYDATSAGIPRGVLL